MKVLSSWSVAARAWTILSTATSTDWRVCNLFLIRTSVKVWVNTTLVTHTCNQRALTLCTGNISSV